MYSDVSTTGEIERASSEAEQFLLRKRARLKVRSVPADPEPVELHDVDVMSFWEPATSKELWLKTVRFYNRSKLALEAPDPSYGYWSGVVTDEIRRVLAAKDVEVRLAELREVASDEGVAWSDASEEAFRSFLKKYRPTSRPAIFVSDAGALRATWEGSGAEIHLSFLEGEKIGFVLLRPAALPISGGAASVSELLAFLGAAGMSDLIVA